MSAKVEGDMDEKPEPSCAVGPEPELPHFAPRRVPVRGRLSQPPVPPPNRALAVTPDDSLTIERLVR